MLAWISGWWSSQSLRCRILPPIVWSFLLLSRSSPPIVRLFFSDIFSSQTWYFSLQSRDQFHWLWDLLLPSACERSITVRFPSWSMYRWSFELLFVPVLLHFCESAFSLKQFRTIARVVLIIETEWRVYSSESGVKAAALLRIISMLFEWDDKSARWMPLFSFPFTYIKFLLSNDSIAVINIKFWRSAECFEYEPDTTISPYSHLAECNYAPLAADPSPFSSVGILS
jgi:hypothetical protein